MVYLRQYPSIGILQCERYETYISKGEWDMKIVENSWNRVDDPL